MEENEIKFALKDYDRLESFLTSLFPYLDIRQGYLNPNNRVREIVHSAGSTEWLFTFKQRQANGSNLEFETLIDQYVFDELWDYTKERLWKRRVSIKQHGLKWDIDFPRWGCHAFSNPRYFAIAECEMPSGWREPDHILELIAPHIIYQVPRDDNRFSSRQLADPENARQLAQELALVTERPTI